MPLHEVQFVDGVRNRDDGLLVADGAAGDQSAAVTPTRRHGTEPEGKRSKGISLLGVKRRGTGCSVPWAPVPSDVVRSCSIAIRRMGDLELRSLAVTSTCRGEGRSTVAIALAAAAMLEHRRTVTLIDLDVERGSIQARTAAGTGPGVSELIADKAELEDCLVAVDEHVTILGSGAPIEPVSLLANPGRLEAIVGKLKANCDILIADLPPLSADITGAHVADLFQTVVLVIRAGGPPVRQIEQMASTLSQRPYVLMNEARLGSRAPWRRSR